MRWANASTKLQHYVKRVLLHVERNRLNSDPMLDSSHVMRAQWCQAMPTLLHVLRAECHVLLYALTLNVLGQRICYVLRPSHFLYVNHPTADLLLHPQLAHLYVPHFS